MSYGAVYLINGSTTYTTAEILALIAAKAASSHTHAMSEVTGLEAAIDVLEASIIGSVPTGAEIVSALNSQLGSTAWQTDYSSAIAGKAATSHTHTLSDITDVTVDSDMVAITKGFRPGLYDDLDTPPVGTIIESSNDGHLYWVHRDGSVHLLCDSGGYGGVAWGAITGTLSDQTDLQTALNLKASLASPAFTGIPTVPTAGGGTSTTQAASTAFVVSTASQLILDAVAGLMDLRGDINCSGTPSYPIGTKGDVYRVSVAGTIGGSFGKPVEVDDALVCLITNGGGIEAAVGASWWVLQGNMPPTLRPANNLSDLASASTARTNLGLEIGSQVQGYAGMLQQIASHPQPFDAFLYYDNSGVLQNHTITSAGRALLDDSTATAQRTTLGLTIGTNVQAYSAQLTTFDAILVTPLAHANQAAVSGTAGGTYTATEQSLLNNVVTLLNRLRTELIAARIIKGSA